MEIRPGLSAALVHVVGKDDTAVAMGSGDVPVLATPKLLAVCEGATIAALSEAYLPVTQTSVGSRVSLEHMRPSGVGETITAVATLTRVEDRLLVFDIAVSDDADRVVGHAVVTRVIVDREQFVARA